jgi:hypothetical protein
VPLYFIILIPFYNFAGASKDGARGDTRGDRQGSSNKEGGDIRGDLRGDTSEVNVDGDLCGVDGRWGCLLVGRRVGPHLFHCLRRCRCAGHVGCICVILK